MPRHLISDAHEWINEIPTVPVYYPAKPQPRERAWQNQRGKKTLRGTPPLFLDPPRLAGGFPIRAGSLHCRWGVWSGAAHLLKDNAVRIRTVKAWPIDPLDLRNLKLRCRKSYLRGITPTVLVAAKRFIATLLFDPSMSALPIIVKQNSPSVGLFTHQ
ncbi:hypothetical protein Patl1_37559 [Pistacia atlantica]|nr:hypothetical protein Patl1_37559 [Pistacia atlantica]